MAEPRPKAPVAPGISEGPRDDIAPAAAPVSRREVPLDLSAEHVLTSRKLEEELLHELRRMNSQLGWLTHGYRRYTTSFFAGIIRGLGAAIGATVIFAIFLTAVSRLDTTPIIGNYVKRIMAFTQHSSSPFLDPSTPSAPVVAIASDPSGARVFVDGKDSGRVTPCSDLGVAPGHHLLRLVRDEYEALVEIDARPGVTMDGGTAKLAPIVAPIASSAPIVPTTPVATPSVPRPKR